MHPADCALTPPPPPLPAAQQEFEKICEETDLANKLNELDRLSNASTAGVGPENDLATVAPVDAMRDLRMKMKLEERERLKLMLQQTEGECEAARSRLESHRAKVDTMEKAVSDASGQLQSAATIAHEWIEQQPVQA